MHHQPPALYVKNTEFHPGSVRTEPGGQRKIVPGLGRWFKTVRELDLRCLSPVEPEQSQGPAENRARIYKEGINRAFRF